MRLVEATTGCIGAALLAAPRLNHILSSASQLINKIQQSGHEDQLNLVLPFVDRIVIKPEHLGIHIKRHELMSLLHREPIGLSKLPELDDKYLLTIPFQKKRRGIETRLVIGGGNQHSSVDSKLALTIAKAYTWFEDLKSGTSTSINDIAKAESLPASEVSRQLRLAFIAPKIVQAIIRGRQPVGLTAKSLLRATNIPQNWDHQVKLGGFA